MKYVYDVAKMLYTMKSDSSKLNKIHFKKECNAARKISCTQIVSAKKNKLACKLFFTRKNLSN